MQSKIRYANIGGRLLDLTSPKIMGIINVTPDSFYKSSRYKSDNEIINAAKRMLDEGADILDVGGYSSRPGAEDISAVEEGRRVLNAIRLIISNFPDAVVSVDTFRSDIARDAVCNCGAHIINDISAGEADKMMIDVVAELNVPYIMMHMKGTPLTMQHNPEYNDVVSDILKWFGEKIVKLNSFGVKDIIIDPGFGFGKTVSQNFELLNRLEDFSITGLPILVGLSRKSMIWKTLGVNAEDALNGTAVLNSFAMMKGADIIRVHDVKEANQLRTLFHEMKKSQSNGTS